MKLYRYLTNGEGVWSAGKRLLPLKLVDEANQNRAWLKNQTYQMVIIGFGLQKPEKKNMSRHSTKPIKNIYRVSQWKKWLKKI